MKYTAKTTYTDKSIVNEYDSFRFRSWKGKLVDRLEKRSIINGIIILVGNRKDILLLDAPAGTGRLSESLIKEGYNVVAVDISKPMLQKAQSIHKLANYPNFLGFVCCNLEHLPFRENSVDIVTSLRITGHLPSDVKKQVLDEFRKVCRLGVVIMFALDNMLLKLKRWLLGTIGVRPKAAMWFPLRHNGIIALCIDKGFNIVKFKDLIKFITESRVYILRHK